MENLIINRTINTPDILFDIDKKTFSICGNSLPENPTEFYMIIDDYINNYLKQYQNDKLTVVLDVTYMNTSSGKRIFNLIKKCIEKFKVINIIWLYDNDDDDIHEQGKDFEHGLGIDFEFKTKQ